MRKILTSYRFVPFPSQTGILFFDMSGASSVASLHKDTQVTFISLSCIVVAFVVVAPLWALFPWSCKTGKNVNRWQFPTPINKGRFCNTIPSIALVHTSIQSDSRLQTKEILSSRISKQTKPQSCPETSKANSRLVRAKGGF